MLWWEGVPAALRGEVWSHALTAAAASPGRAVADGAAGKAASCSAGAPDGASSAFTLIEYSIAFQHAQPSDLEAAAAALSATLSPSDATRAPAPELNLFSSPLSPLHASLKTLLAALKSAARRGGPPPPPSAVLLGCMLLLYMDEQSAYEALRSLASTHCVGRRPAHHGTWRLLAADAMIARELPQLHAHLASLGVQTSAWLPEWHSTLFLSTLPLDVAARLWDCYLRDGEPLLWHASLALLRVLTPRLMPLTSASACLETLLRSRTSPDVSEKAIFSHLTADCANSDSASHMSAVWRDLSQRLPLPTAEGSSGACYDLWQNSTLCDAADEAGGGPPGSSATSAAAGAVSGASASSRVASGRGALSEDSGGVEMQSMASETATETEDDGVSAEGSERALNAGGRADSGGDGGATATGTGPGTGGAGAGASITRGGGGGRRGGSGGWLDAWRARASGAAPQSSRSTTARVPSEEDLHAASTANASSTASSSSATTSSAASSSQRRSSLRASGDPHNAKAAPTERPEAVPCAHAFS